MTAHSDVIIIGSGPAGVSAAWPLVESGVQVLLFDAGTGAFDDSAVSRPDLSALRSGNFPQRQDFLGKEYSTLRQNNGVSPKLRTMPPDGYGEEYLAANTLQTENFRMIGALGTAGLSAVWGGAVAAFDANEMAKYPVPYDDMKRSYGIVAERIGLSGSTNDDLGAYLGEYLPVQPALPLSPAVERLYAAYGRFGGFPDLTMGRARNAVLSRDHNGARACSLNGGCMWGCPTGAVYSSYRDLEALRRFPNFKNVNGRIITKIDRADHGIRIEAKSRNGAETSIYESGSVVLAAGTLASSRLVAQALKLQNQTTRLLTTPGIAFVLLQPSWLGRAMPQSFYGMAQLCFRHALSSRSGDELFGLIYDAAGVSAVDVMASMPLSRPSAVALTKALQPAMLICLAFFPGEYSSNVINLNTNEHGETEMKIKGGNRAGFDLAIREAVRQLRKRFLKLGALILPGSLTVLEPGADSHYGGAFPMGERIGADGEVTEMPGLYVADGTVLNALPAKNLTFTIMANADRIGRNLSRKLKNA
ncbi:MAG: FAD-dependent oxidoreductase [Rhodospirillales bacterium]